MGGKCGTVLLLVIWLARTQANCKFMPILPVGADIWTASCECSGALGWNVTLRGMASLCPPGAAQAERAGVYARQAFKDRTGKAAIEKQAFSSSVSNFFQTDVISRTSINMAKCVQTRASLAHK